MFGFLITKIFEEYGMEISVKKSTAKYAYTSKPFKEFLLLNGQDTI